MIVDIHTHTPTHREAVPDSERRSNQGWRPDRVVEAAYSWQDHADAMDVVDAAIVFAIAPPPGQPAFEMSGIPWSDDTHVNDQTAAYVRSNPQKLLGFLSVHPDEPNALEEVERGVSELGMVGIKLGPNYQNFDPLGKAARAIYEEAVKRDLPVLFHQGTSPIRTAPIRYAHPLVMDEVAILYPEMRVIMAHMGHPWQADCITVIRKHPNVYADISGLFYRPYSFYNCMRLAVEWNVTQKLLFASDYPITTPAENMAALRNINENAGNPPLPVPTELMEEIIHRDTLGLLGLVRHLK